MHLVSGWHVDSDAVGLGWGPWVFISNTHPGDTDAAVCPKTLPLKNEDLRQWSETPGERSKYRGRASPGPDESASLGTGPRQQYLLRLPR